MRRANRMGKTSSESGSRVGVYAGVLSGLLALAMIFPGEGHAQFSAPLEPVAGRPGVALTQPDIAKGPHEGIQVHGHWTIEVKNPDGTVAVRRDFENSLTTNDPGGQSGDFFLTQLLTPFGSLTVSTPGGSENVPIAGSTWTQLQSVIGQNPSALTQATFEVPFLSIGFNSPGLYSGSSGAPAQTVCTSSSGCTLATSLTPFDAAQSGYCPPGSGCGNEVQLSASYTAASAFTISGVSTVVNYLTVTWNGSASFFALTTNLPSYSFTSQTLGPAGSCGSTNQQPCQVPVAAGESVSVTVVLSFT